jgi:uncharacterized protein
MKTNWFTLLLGGFLFIAFLSPVCSAEPVKVLAITNSAGFEHSVVRREKGELGHAERILVEIGKKNNMIIVPTKDGGLIHPAVLEQFDVVFFYTTGELEKAGKDGSLPMNADNRDALIEWIENGGGFVGSHTCTDTFHHWEKDGKKPYIELVGGEFATHGQQETGFLNVQKHPITAHLSTNEPWSFVDEWYIFKNVNNSLTPLLILDTKKMKQEAYNSIDPYPVCGIKDVGKGKVFTCALGHREDVWSDAKFQQLMINGINWAAGKLK